MLWFTHGVFRWRAAASVVWVCLLSCPALLLYQLLSTCHPLHPLTWIHDWLYSALSPRSICFGTLYIFILSLSSLIYSLTYTVTLPIHKTRLSVLWSVLSPGRMVVIVTYMLLGGGASYCLAELAGYHHLWGPHQSYQYCLNEYLFFQCLCGVFMGLRYGAGYYLHKDNFLVFPSIQQQKLFRLRGHLSSHLWEGLVWTLKGLRYYYPLYYLLGYYPRNRLIRMLGLQLRDDVRLTSLSALLDIGLLAQLLVAITTLHVGWSFGLRIFRTFQTESIRFPIVATFSGEASRVLTNAMKCKSTPLVMYLGFLDLHQIALHSSSRRQQVFSLNQNGKPAVWGDLSQQCVSLVNALTTRLGGRVEGGGSAAPVTTPPTTAPLSNGFSPRQKGWPNLSAGVLSPPGVSRRVVNTEKTRLWSYSPGAMGAPLTPPPVQRPPSSQETFQKQVQKMVSELKSFPKKVKEKLRKKPFFTYFLSDLPGVATQEMFSDCRLQVWAITGISELAVASYTEDQYGVVQRTLPDILKALLGLSQALEKHVKAPLSNAKSTRNTRVALEANGRYAIKTAVQTSLHHLAATFAKEMRSLQLTEDQVMYWNQFMGTRQEWGHL